MDFLSKMWSRANTYVPVKAQPYTTAPWHEWISKLVSNTSLDLVGLVVLAEFPAVARRTALMGTSAFADALVLCPGLHRQQNAAKLNDAEYPACAAMTTGYVFRVENQATVYYLQRVGQGGCLTNLTVSNNQSYKLPWLRASSGFYLGTSLISAVAYVSACTLTVIVIVLLILLEDWWSLLVVGILIFARLTNVLVIRSQATMGWKGEREPGQKSDLIILLSQDRWIRIRGAVDDIKAITSGEWLRESTFLESSLLGFATLMVYLDVALVVNSSIEGKLLLTALLFCSSGLLGIANQYTTVLSMYGRTIMPDGPPQSYRRRLVLTKQLIKETGRGDWAIRLGMAQPSDIEDVEGENEGNQDTSARNPARQVEGQVTM